MSDVAWVLLAFGIGYIGGRIMWARNLKEIKRVKSQRRY